MSREQKWDPCVFRNNEHVMSPSQYVSYTTCPRLWWLGSIRKMPDLKDQGNRDVGTILHSACERWLLADDTGRDRGTGQPVDPFPEGWDVVGGKRLSPSDAAMVRRVFADGVERGVLRRLPGRQVEVGMVLTVLPGEVAMIGVEDQRAPGVVEDHKSTGSRRWALSRESLRTDPKMMCYARDEFRRGVGANSAHPDHPTVRLRLNYFCKDPRQDPPTWAVEADVGQGEVMHFWEEEVVPVAREMLSLKRRKLPDDAWKDVEGPRVPNACRKYGGCPYATICGGLTTTETHRRRAAQLKKTTETKENDDMSAFDRAKKRGVTTPETGSATAVATPPQETQTNQPQVPPWTQAGCNACKGKGINSAGNACRACDVVSGRTGGQTSAQFQLWHDDQGNLCWGPPDGKAPAETKAPPKVPQEPEPAAQAPAEPKPAAQEVAKPKADSLRPGFTLYVNCVPLDEEYVDLSRLLYSEGQELASVEKAGSYFELDPWKRKDALASKAKVVAAALDGRNLVALGSSQELKSYLDALRPLAARTVVGTF